MVEAIAGWQSLDSVLFKFLYSETVGETPENHVVN